MNVFMTGATGYIGRHLIPELVTRGHVVRALVREGSENKLARGAIAVRGNALDASTFADQIAPSDTFVQLVGVAHPSPAKAAEFRAIDLVSIRESVAAASRSTIRHFVYLSVAQPAPIMQAYLWVRALGEAMIREAGLTATIIRPWYVLGPGHWWPKALVPLYKLLEAIPATRAGALRLGLVTIDQMVAAIVHAAENPPPPGQQRIVDVAAIRRVRL